MRKLILQMQYSLDGFVSSPNGELDWIFPDFDAEYAVWCVERLWLVGAHVMGGATYRDMAAHWPSSTEPYAAPMNQIPKVVFSGSLKSADWGDTRIVSGDLAKEIARLKQEPGRDLLAHGGVRFAQSLVRTRSIDEYRLIIHPVVLGRGKGIFSDLAAQIRFKLVNQAIFKTGLIAMEMQPA